MNLNFEIFLNIILKELSDTCKPLLRQDLIKKNRTTFRKNISVKNFLLFDMTQLKKTEKEEAWKTKTCVLFIFNLFICDVLHDSFNIPDCRAYNDIMVNEQ
jgi:hypothetical protein